MLLVFVHGWGVQHADYGALPQRLRDALGGESVEVWLSQYISYSDAVTMNDLAAAFERARVTQFPGKPFVCVTHSTGGPILRTWLLRYEGSLKHLILLAPPNHGSALAQLGKGRVSRLRCWTEGIEPGERILDWLELGSDAAWDLNVRWLDIDWAARGVTMAVVSGATPDPALYDHLNSYTGEAGSDGVVRVAAANLNYSFLRLQQEGGELVVRVSARSALTQMLAWLGESHTSIHLGVRRPAEGPRQPVAMLIFRVTDDSGETVEDFDVLLTGGPEHSPDALPQGFFIDRQRNSVARHSLTYFLNYAALHGTEVGFVVRARPDSGPVRYASAEYRGENPVRPDETTLIEITLQRMVEDQVFVLRPDAILSRA